MSICCIIEQVIYSKNIQKSRFTVCEHDQPCALLNRLDNLPFSLVHALHFVVAERSIREHQIKDTPIEQPPAIYRTSDG